MPDPATSTTSVSLGRIVATPAALEFLDQSEIDGALRRHACGDWGEVSAADRAANDAALREGTRLLSVFRARRGRSFWVITEADRSVTTVLLPEDY
jgi:hypothetical protein